jgi:nucleotidyltransferase substrate binding protein (TIGR01987 family)
MARSEKFRRAFEKFEKAFNKYREIVGSPKLFDALEHEWIVEIATKRFEYTYESLWKVLKEYFRQEGVECSTPLSCFKEAFKAGLIPETDDENFLEMIDKRNQIVHVYDGDQAEKIYKFITAPKTFQALKNVYQKLKQL